MILGQTPINEMHSQPIESPVFLDADIILVKPNAHISNCVPPIGLGYLAAELRRVGIKVGVLDCVKDMLTPRQCFQIIRGSRTNIIGLTVCTNEVSWAGELARLAKGSMDVMVLVGGPHPSGRKKDIFVDMPEADYAFYGESEKALRMIVPLILDGRTGRSHLSGVPNLIWRCDGGVCVNPPEIYDDLNEAPFPAWDIMRPETYRRIPHGGFSRFHPTAPIITSRGCPYGCRFCAGPLISGRKIRLRHPLNVLEEVQILVKNHGVREIHIEDDNFTFYRDFTMALCEKIIESGLNIAFGLPNGIRVDKIDDELLRVMRRAGFYSVVLGIESGSSDVLRRMNKKLDLAIVPEKIRLLRKHNFIVKAFFMMGYPGETRSDIVKTLTLANELDIDRAFFSVFIPLPGTPDFYSLLQDGEMDSRNMVWDDFYTGDLSKLPYVTPTLTEHELRGFVTRAYRSFYLRPRTIWRLARELNSLDQIRHLVSRAMKLLV